MNKSNLENDVNSGLSSYSMSKKYNLSQTTIQYWLKKFELKSKFKPITFYDKIDWNKCQKFHDDGMTWNELKILFPHNGMVWAIKNKKLKMRSRNESKKLAHKNGKVDYSVYRTEEFRKNQSKFGGYKENSGRCKHIPYKTKTGIIVDIQGTWEEKLVKFLDEKNVIWERNKKSFKYLFENKESKYFPDFYIPSLNSFIEVKGYQTKRDEAKWKHFPYSLLIVKKNEIQNLNYWFTNNFCYVHSSLE